MFGQFVEQRFVGGGVGGTHVVERLYQTAAEIVRPEPIGDGAGEEWIFRSGHPFGQDRTAVGSVAEVGDGRPQGLGRHRFAGARMAQLAALLGENRLAAAGQSFAAYAREEPGQGVIILLAPAVGRVMMALGTLNANAEE